ncbi:hypothetical protein H8B13_04390 [Hymenobacter sp. BT188]|uniref:hypothetical protein n=1 Tax=Hymenobacter sp. BT188 TaxID=2763504 RepID=UPI001650E315|nr:hypothetical protein [Hymenobacter sp. BT188]MBC6606050.1 hypothetical protein [Hymenobacter sp. BT188]
MRPFLLAYLLFFGAVCAQAQDIILRRNGDEIKARVLAITPTEISYVPGTEPPSSDTLYMTAIEVFMIRYANGTKELITKAEAIPALERTSEEMTTQGREDARKYFKASGAFWGTFGATAVSVPVLGGLGGAATGAAIAASPPKDQNLIVPDKALLNDPSYVRGYEKQAQRKKLGNAAAGFGVGLVSGAAVWLAIALTNTNHF